MQCTYIFTFYIGLSKIKLQINNFVSENKSNQSLIKAMLQLNS